MMIRRVDEILVFFTDKKTALIHIGEAKKFNGYNSVLFKKLEHLLFIENVENHKTDLELILDAEGNYQLNFYNLTDEDRRKNNELINSVLNEYLKDILVKNGLEPISKDELKNEMKLILAREAIHKVPYYNHELFKIIRAKGYAVLESDILDSDVMEIRKSLE